MFEEMLVYLPTVIRVAAVFLAVCLVCDYFKRKWAKSIVEAVKASGADSPETALSAAELEKTCRRFTRYARILLRRSHAPLRRYILCAKDEEPCDADSKKRKNRSDKLTGAERWYILPADTSDEEEKAPAHALPAVLRDGAEISPVKLVIGIVLLFIFSELLIHYLVPIYNFVNGLAGADK